MLVSAVVCPHPPALVPAVARRGASALDVVREASLRAVRRLHEVPHDALLCVGAGPETLRSAASVGGSLLRYGVAARFGGAESDLPLALTIGAYLAETAGLRVLGYQSIADDQSAEACRAIGEALGNESERVALLVMGDGSAKRTLTAPGYLDDRAEPFDAEVLRALGEPDPAALLRLDPEVARDLWVAGRPAWQALAGALLASSTAWVGRVDCAEAPLGVGSFVLSLSPDPRRPRSDGSSKGQWAGSAGGGGVVPGEGFGWSEVGASPPAGGLR